jgi:hypothetical protein
MLRILILIAAVPAIALAAPAWPLKPDLSPDRLGRMATHVVTGKVTAVYERTETVDDWNYTRYVAEVRVDGCEKGDGVKKGDIVYVRYWRRAWAGKGAPNPRAVTYQYRHLPGAGEALRIYLARNSYDGFTVDNKDGGFNVIGPNGFEQLLPATGK